MAHVPEMGKKILLTNKIYYIYLTGIVAKNNNINYIYFQSTRKYHRKYLTG